MDSNELSKFTRKIVLVVLGTTLLLLTAIGGCAYELYQENRVVNPARLSQVQTVAVTPFRYSHDWTGYFRDIYRDAGLDYPTIKKIDQIEATFLTEGMLLSRGYQILAWPIRGEDINWESSQSLNKMKKILPSIRKSGADAVLLQKGRTHCPKLHQCKAEVRMRLLDTISGELLWEGQGSGETLLSHGDEMRAAVEEVLSSLPRPQRRSN